MKQKESSLMKKQRKTLTPFIWFSIIFHLILLIILLTFAFRKKITTVIKKISGTKKEIPAALQPRKSAFGTTVLFDDRAVFSPAKAKLMAKEKQKGEQHKEKLVVQKKKEKQKEQIPQKGDAQKETKQKQLLIVKKDKLKKRNKGIKEQKQEKQEKKVAIKKSEKIEERIKQIEKQQALIAKLKTVGEAEKDKSPIQPPKKRSIIAMTKGFVENLKHKGEDWLERKGDPNKRPSFKELKYISYEQKVNWYLQNSWKQNFAHQPWQRALEGKAVIDFKINEDGSILDVHILQSSGNDSLDDMILKSVKLAAPFPPLPKHFGKKIYKTGRIIYVNSHNLRI